MLWSNKEKSGIDVGVESSNPGVGVIVGSPAIFNANEFLVQNVFFDPMAVGATTLSVVTPPGTNFVTPRTCSRSRRR